MGPDAMVQTSSDSIDFGAVARETFTKHHYLPYTLWTLPSYRNNNVKKHIPARTSPNPSVSRGVVRQCAPVVRQLPRFA